MSSDAVLGGERVDPTRGDSAPGRYWARTNIAEAVSDVLSPLCWSIWSMSMYRARSIGYGGLGLSSTKSKPVTSQNELSNAVFFGRLALNVDLNRAMWASLPGMSDADFERSTAGSVRDGLIPTPKAWSRLPLVIVKSVATLATHDRRMRARYAQELAWWRRTALVGAVSSSPRALFVEARSRFEQSMGLHLKSRFLQIFFVGRLAKIAKRGGSPELLGAIVGGFGDVAEVALADDLWKVSRNELDMDEFLSRHGYHAPHEGNVYTVSWRDNRAPLVAIASAMSQSPATERPGRRAERAARRHDQAAADLLAGLPRRARPWARFALGRLEALTRDSELGKASFIIDLDVLRFAARRVGDELVASGALQTTDDVFFLLAEEFLVEAPDDAMALVDARRARRDEYAELELPKTFVGMPAPVRRTTGGGTRAVPTSDEPLRGVPASGGTVEGVAVVVDDPSDDVQFDSGNVLVCRTTDPSWTPLLALCSALVVDIGSLVSHGAIAARELGIPCVMGIQEGTARLRTGDVVRVDGDAGTVSVIAGAAVVDAVQNTTGG